MLSLQGRQKLPHPHISEQPQLRHLQILLHSTLHDVARPAPVALLFVSQYSGHADDPQYKFCGAGPRQLGDMDDVMLDLV